MTMDERVRVVIADDEPRARQFLEKLLSEHDQVEVRGRQARALEGPLRPQWRDFPWRDDFSDWAAWSAGASMARGARPAGNGRWAST